MDLAETIRVLDRILITLGGVMSIYLGYRLFYVTKQATSAATLALGDLVDASVKRVGPGVFFALFGAWILATSLDRDVKIRTDASVSIDTQATIQRIAELVSNLPVELRDEILSELAVLQIQSETTGRRIFIGDRPPPNRSEVPG